MLVSAIYVAVSPLETWIVERESNLTVIYKAIYLKLKNTPIENIITLPAYVAVPALQVIFYCMNDKQLKEMFAELLAHAMNSETVDNIYPTYMEIIKQMSSYDAFLFKKN